MAETLLQKAQRLGIQPQTTNTSGSNDKVVVPQNTQRQDETLLQKAQRLGIQPASKEQKAETLLQKLQKDTSYSGRIASEMVGGAQKIGKSIMKGSESIEEGMQDVRAGNTLSGFGKSIKGAAESAFGTIAGGSRIALSPITPAMSKLANVVIPVLRSVNPTIAEAFDTVVPKINDLVSKYPDQAQLASDIIETLSLLIGGKVAGNTIKEAAKKSLTKDGLSSTGRETLEALKNVKGIVVKPESSKVWDIIKPEMGTKEIETIGARKIQEGLLGTTKVVPTPRGSEMIGVATPYVSKAKSTYDAIQNMRSAIKESAERARAYTIESDAIWNKNELSGVLNKIEEPITVKSDKTLHNTFQNLKRAVLSLADKADKKPYGLLDVRQQFDDLIEREFGASIYDKTNPFSRLVRDFREKITALTESKLSPDNKFRIELRKQTLLYDAIDNASGKLGKEGTNKLIQWAKENPKKAKVMGYGSLLLGGGGVARNILGL